MISYCALLNGWMLSVSQAAASRARGSICLIRSSFTIWVRLGPNAQPWLCLPLGTSRASSPSSMVDELGPVPLDGAQAETQSSPEDEVRPDAVDGTPALSSGIPKGVQYGSLNGFREVLALAG